MSQNNSKKKLQNVLPLLSYKQIISLVILLLVTSSSTQTPSTPYVCPTDCECNIDNFSARCENLESLIASYSRKHASKKFMPIKSLDLSNNELTKISNQLEVLVNLTELNLSHNKLSQVRKLNFQHLETLDLSYNHITSGKLSKLPKNIVSLNLAHNDITYLPIDFMKLKKLRTLDLHENPLNCTCETLHVRNWMSYQNVWSSKVIKCTSPQIVKGQPWLQARQNDICLEATTTRSIKKTWDDIEDNDIMMGDQPQDDDNGGDQVEDVLYDNNEEEGEDIFDKEMQKDEEKIDNTDDIDYDDDKKEKDELGGDFLVVKPDPHNHESTSVVPEHLVENPNSENINEDEDGSGASEPKVMEMKEPEDDDDSSGSGDGIPIIIPSIDHSKEHSTESTSEEPTTEIASSQEQIPTVAKPDDEDEYDTEDDKEATEAPLVPLVPHVPEESEKPDENQDEDEKETTLEPVITGSSTKKYDLSMGIFEDKTDPPTIIPGKGQKNKVEQEETPPEQDVEEVTTFTGTGGKAENIKTATTEDNTGTYVLLAIIGILLVSLIIFVAMKNRQEKRNARRGYDVEKNGATELQDMDKRQGLLGKPLEKNGNGKHAERSPLMNDFADQKDGRPEFTSFKPPEITVDEPIQELSQKEKEKSQQSLYDMPNGNGNVHEPIEAVHASPTNVAGPKSPDSDEEVFHPASDTPIDPESLNVSPEPPKRYSPVYPPVSPRSARYSPVYSPETGRVKIKLTETPKPKTPVVVTRSRSRAGDYINTPNN